MLLDSSWASYLWVVLDEAVLRCPVGRPDVMRGQLRHLLACAQRPGITLQVLPFMVGGHAAAGGPFSILRFAEPDLPDIVYLEQLTSALYLDRRDAVEHYIEVMDRLAVSALPAQQSMEMIANVLRRAAGRSVPVFRCRSSVPVFRAPAGQRPAA